MALNDTAPTNPLSSRDAYVIAELLAALREVAATEQAPLALAAVRDSFVAVSLLPPRAGTSAVRDAVASLEHRFRFALGEYLEPPWRDQA